jgi:mono/diheme cytochrome c family protein
MVDSVGSDLRGAARSASGNYRTLSAVALLFALVSGCSTKNSSPEFRLNMQDILQAMESHSPDEFRVTGDEADDDERQDKENNYKKLEFLSTALYAAFGTPDEPFVFDEVRWNADDKKGLDLRKIELAAGPYGGSADGKQRGLFRQHCAHCHGVSGDGAGPTAAFLHPYPRDYRQGIFKFKSTQRSGKPTNDDLKRILQNGIPGTAMPSFLMLPNDEIEALVEYVKYLSIRGETERNMAFAMIVSDEEIEPTKAGILDDYLQPVVDAWAEAEEQVVNPPTKVEASTPEELAASIARGREIFLSKAAQCIQCHGPTALGDGKDGGPLKDYDDWNKDKQPGAMAHWLLPKQELRPRNLRMGIYHGGRRPLDLYRRIRGGIPGTPMPAGGEGATAVLKAEDIWHVVDFIQSLPFEEASEPAHFEATAMMEHQ